MNIIFRIAEGQPPIPMQEGPVLFGAPLLSATAGASTVGLFGAGGIASLSTTIATLGSAASFIAPVLGVVGGIQQAQAIQAQTAAQTAQLRAQADADAFNARIATQNAKIVQGQTTASLEKADRERRLRQGANIAAAGASGAGIGSALDILQDSAAQEELNLLTIESEGLLRKREFTTQESLLKASSQNRLGQIPGVETAGRTGVASAVLSGVSSGIRTGSSLGVF